MSVVDWVEWGQMVGIGPGGTYEFPSVPGVYVFAKVTTAGADVRYVGRTRNLQKRISGHLEHSDNDCLRGVLNDPTSVKIRATIQGGENVRMNIEHTCYIHYLGQGHSLCNDARPGGRYLEGMQWPF